MLHCGHVRGGTALLARQRRQGRAGDRPPRGRPPRRRRSGLPGSPQRHRRPGACLEARAAGAPGPLQRGRAGGLAHRRARARAQARPPGDRRVPRRQGRARPADRRRAEPRPGQRAAAPADRLPLRARRRPGAAARVLRLALAPALPLDPVRAPPRQPALHARAGHHPRGRRPRAPARDPDVLRAAPADRRGDQPPARRGEPALPLARVLVHGRVRRRRRARRAEGLRRGHPVVVRRDRRVPRHGAPPDRPGRDGHRRLRHHPLPARPLPGGVDGRGARGGRRLLLHLHRRVDLGAARTRRAAAA